MHADLLLCTCHTFRGPLYYFTINNPFCMSCKKVLIKTVALRSDTYGGNSKVTVLVYYCVR